MPENLDAIYQNGEKIPFSGTFEVVGVSLAHAVPGHESAIREFKAGEYFPDYKGMEISWHSVCSDKRQDIKPTSSNTTANV